MFLPGAPLPDKDSEDMLLRWVVQNRRFNRHLKMIRDHTTFHARVPTNSGTRQTKHNVSPALKLYHDLEPGSWIRFSPAAASIGWPAALHCCCVRRFLSMQTRPTHSNIEGHASHCTIPETRRSEADRAN